MKKGDLKVFQFDEQRDRMIDEKENRFNQELGDDLMNHSDNHTLLKISIFVFLAFALFAMVSNAAEVVGISPTVNAVVSCCQNSVVLISKVI